MRIFKTQYFIPHGFNLMFAIRAYFLDVRGAVNTFPAGKKLHLKLVCDKVVNRFTFPDVVRIKYDIGFCVVNYFIAQGYDVGNGLSAFTVIKPPYLFKAWICNLAYVIAYLYFRYNLSIDLDSR